MDMETVNSRTEDEVQKLPPKPLISSGNAGKTIGHYVEESGAVNSPKTTQEREGRHVDFIMVLCYGYPKTVLITLLGFCSICTYFTFGYFDITDPYAGLRLREDDTARRTDAWIMALEEAANSLENIKLTYSPLEAQRRLLVEKTIPRRRKLFQQDQQSIVRRSLTLMYMTIDGSNLFTTEYLQRIMEIEEDILNSESYEDFCALDSDTGECRPRKSLVSFLPSNFSTQEEIDTAIEEALSGANYDGRMHFAKDFDLEENPVSSITRSDFPLGRPLEGFANTGDRSNAQGTLVRKWIEKELIQLAPFESDNLRVVFNQRDLIFHQSEELLYDDLFWAIGGILSVMLMMIIQMRSIFLGVFAMIQILFSFPVAFFVYRFILGIELFGGLQVISIFIILGIGADDCFIYVSAVKQNFMLLKGNTWTEEAKLSVAFRSARFTMWTTTVTTGFAFALQMISVIPLVRYFGVLTSMLVFVNYMLVTTFYTCVLILYVKWFMPSRIKNNAEEAEKNESHDYREGGSPADQFCRDVYARIVQKKYVRYTVLFVVGCLLCGMAYSATTLVVAESEAEALPSDHPIQLVFDLIPEAFLDFSNSNTKRVKLVHGIVPPYIDRAGTKETESDSTDFGKPIYADPFQMNLSDPEAQEYLFDICYYNEFTEEDNPLYIKPDTCRSPLTGFGLWRKSRNETFPVTLPLKLENELVPSRLQNTGPSLATLLADFLSRPQFFKFISHLMFVRDNGEDANDVRIGFTYSDFRYFADRRDSFLYREQVVKGWDAFLEPFNSLAPSSLTDAYYAEGDWFIFYSTQLSFVRNALFGTFLSLGLAFGVVAIATNNYIVSGIAIFAICGIFLCVVGFITALGYQLDSIFSICISILVGVAVDYVVHIAVAYNESKNSHRIQDSLGRVRYALYLMGLPILSGAMTTLAAAIFLALPTTLLILGQFGFFFATSIVISLLFGLMVYPVMLATFGPQGRKGVLFKWLESRSMDLYDPNRHLKTSSTWRKRLVGTYLLIMAVLYSISIYFYLALEFASNSGGDEILDISREAYLPKGAVLEPGDWNELIPPDSSSSLCAKDDPFSFFFKKSESPDVNTTWIIEFQGFAACWNKATCEDQNQIYVDNLDFERTFYSGINAGTSKIEGFADPDGPFGKFHHLIIPYCSADLYLGNSTYEYASGRFVKFRGAVNTKIALDWLVSDSELSIPNKVVVWGSGVAGGIASIFWSSYIIEEVEKRKSSTRVLQFSDSALGLFDLAALIESYTAWNTYESFALSKNTLPEELRNKESFNSLTIPELYLLTAIRFPQHTFSQFSSVYDFSQANFLGSQIVGFPIGEVVGSQKRDFSEALRELYDFRLLASKLLDSIIEYEATYDLVQQRCVNSNLNCSHSVFIINGSKACVPFSCDSNFSTFLADSFGSNAAVVFEALLDVSPSEECESAICDVVLDPGLIEGLVEYAASINETGTGNFTFDRRLLQIDPNSCNTANVSHNCSIAVFQGFCADVTCSEDVELALEDVYGEFVGDFLAQAVLSLPQIDSCEFNNSTCNETIVLTNESGILAAQDVLLEIAEFQLSDLGINISDFDELINGLNLTDLSASDLLELLALLESVSTSDLSGILELLGLEEASLVSQLLLIAILGTPPSNYFQIFGMGDNGPYSRSDLFFFTKSGNTTLLVETIHAIFQDPTNIPNNVIDCLNEGPGFCELSADLREKYVTR